MTKVDTNRNLVAALSYVPFVSIFISAAVLFVEKDEKFIRFHAFQALFLSLFYYFASIILGRLTGSFLVFLAGSIQPFFALLALGVWVVSMVRAYRGEVFKWPIVGEIAEKQVGKA